MFKDHFSRQAEAYRRHRPGYPRALVDHVSACAPGHSLAIDCATGNGQAAVQLAAAFDVVLAVDGSHAQLSLARPQAKVRYAAALAESLPVRSGSVDLVAAAQAAHWFDFDRFHAECRRVLRPGGIVAAWTYEKFRGTAAIDALVDDFYANEVGPFWPRERRYVDEGYRTLPFPYTELPAPPFELVSDWTLDDVMGYLATWSAVQRYKDAKQHDPLPALRERLAMVWHGGESVRFHWPIHLRLGRV